jgi:hypothetical protein
MCVPSVLRIFARPTAGLDDVDEARLGLLGSRSRIRGVDRDVVDARAVDSPWKPQLYGIQTTVTSWSPILSAFMRA